jgi:C-terminal processing protease CtpA/Prc
MWNSKWDWRAWLAERLDSLADARGLVIDIRANEGGDDCGDPILARLIDRPISGWPFDVRLRFAAIPGLLRQHSSTWDNGFYTLGAGARPLGNGYFAPAVAETQSRITPAGRPIACPVAVLIGPVNSSATFAFINAARATGKVMLIGETTGGNRRGINGGAILFVKLPGSGITFDLLLKGYVARTPQPDAGIAPDVPVAARIADIQDGTDRAMEEAVRHCLA